MSKGRYRSVEYKRVSWEQVIERASGREVVFAVDVAKEAFVGLLQVKGGEALVRVRWRHPHQTGEMLCALERLGAAGGLEVVMESSGTYGDALRWQLGQRGVAVYRVSGKRVHDAAEVYDGVASMHDAKACDVIAELHSQGRSARWLEVEVQRRELSVWLHRVREDKERQQQLCGRLEGALSRHWPELTGLLELGSASLRALIGGFGGPQQVHGLRTLAAQTLRRAGGPMLSEEKIEAVLDSAAHTLGVPCLVPEREHLRQIANELIEIDQRLKRLEKQIKARAGDDEVLCGVAAQLGAVSMVALWALLGSPSAYPNAHSYCKALGLNLKERSSGRHKGRLKITKRGPALARFYLYFVALRLIAREPLVKRWLEAKSQRPGAIKGKYIVELMRRIAKGIWHHAQGRAFTVAKLFGPVPVLVA